MQFVLCNVPAVTISHTPHYSFAEAAAVRQPNDDLHAPHSRASLPALHIDAILSAKYTLVPGLASFAKEPQVTFTPCAQLQVL